MKRPCFWVKLSSTRLFPGCIAICHVCWQQCHVCLGLTAAFFLHCYNGAHQQRFRPMVSILTTRFLVRSLNFTLKVNWLLKCVNLIQSVLKVSSKSCYCAMKLMNWLGMGLLSGVMFAYLATPTLERNSRMFHSLNTYFFASSFAICNFFDRVSFSMVYKVLHTVSDVKVSHYT